MKDFLKYLIVFILLVMALWSNDRPAHNVNHNFGQRLVAEVGYIKKDFQDVKKEITSFKEIIHFIDNLPTK